MLKSKVLILGYIISKIIISHCFCPEVQFGENFTTSSI